MNPVGEIERGWISERAFFFFFPLRIREREREREREKGEIWREGERGFCISCTWHICWVQDIPHCERERVLVLSNLWVLHFSKYLQKCHWVILFENWKLVGGVF